MVEEFAIMKTPVTVGQYLEFLNDIEPEAAEKHTPRIEDGESYFPRDEHGRYHLPAQDAEGDAWDPRWPILIVNYFDALAFAKWRGQKDGFEYRLPTAMEWEKAARGVDGRIYPWGDHFDATFCNMKDSSNQRPVPKPVGTTTTDVSPFGVLDMAGNIVEWTSTPESSGSDRMTLKGAAYNSASIICRLDVDLASLPQYRYAHYGFRLALTL
jgi:serine/threonine-protein kinase